MWFYVLVIFACLIVFERASNYLVDGLGALSDHLGISEAVLGASVAAMGSSAPEFGSSAFSVAQGNPTIGLGTIVGSAIFNVTIIIGAVGLFGKRKIQGKVFYRDGLFYLLTVGIAIFGIWDGVISQFEAIGWALTFLLYIGWLIYDAKKGEPVPQETFEQLSLRKASTYIIISIIAIALAARYLVVSVGEIFPETEMQAVFSLVVIAIGTSLPDFFTSAQAARKGLGSLAVSNALGSNIFDILACLGIPLSFRTATEVEKTVSASIGALLISVILTLAIIKFNWSLSKKEAAILFGAYVVYITLILII